MKLDEEQFNHIAYAYRATPGEYPGAVVDRYNELVFYVEAQIEAAVLAEREMCAQLCETAQMERHGSIHNAEYCANSIRERKDD